MLLLLLVGGVFVAETLSVIVQVASFQNSHNGKRILKMSPLHHHFELSGWPETKVTAPLLARFAGCSLAGPGGRAMSDMFCVRHGRRVLVIGLGRSGLASVDVLRERGVEVYATDEKTPEELSHCDRSAERTGARFVAPSGVAALASGLTSAILSPGVPPTSPVVRAINAANVPVIGEIELAYRLCRAPIVAVTGTKGKSTTTALIGHLLRECGFDACASAATSAIP